MHHTTLFTSTLTADRQREAATARQARAVARREPRLRVLRLPLFRRAAAASQQG